MSPSETRSLEAELESLKTVRRAEITRRLHEALAVAGDLGDNLDYLDAEFEQEVLEQRIASIEDRLATTALLESRGPAPGVTIGTALEFVDLDTGEHGRYCVVSPADANPSEGRLSIESPVGHSLVGHFAGDTIDVVTPRGYRHLQIVTTGR